MNIDLKTLKSSNIEGIGYDRESKTLAVKFTSGRVYHYADVPKTDYDKMLGSDSPGKYFFRNLRKYPGKLQEEKKDKK